MFFKLWKISKKFSIMVFEKYLHIHAIRTDVVQGSIVT